MDGLADGQGQLEIKKSLDLLNMGMCMCVVLQVVNVHSDRLASR